MKNFLKWVRPVSRIAAESVLMALTAIRNDKFRTFLSLLGVSIGIFSIVAVFTAVNSLKANINEGLSAFGSDVVYIQKWPFTSEDGEEMKWWEYRLRPEVTENDYNFIRRHASTAGTVCYMSDFNSLLKSGGNSFSDGTVLAVSPGFEVLSSVVIDEGRYFSPVEMKEGANAAVIGTDVASALFGGNAPAIGKSMKVKGVSVTVIGVMKEEGSSMISIFRKDEAIIIPLSYGKSIHDVSHYGGVILASPAPGVTNEVFQGEMRQLMRAHRRLPPSKKDDFAINSMTFLIGEIDNITGTLEKIGWIIAFFSLLIGGFGIANIMFVSVKERTAQIGIQKALGAPEYVIVTQFLVEAAVLALAGGIIGIMTVYAICFSVHPEGFTLSIAPDDALKGLLISLVIGILAGLIPAWSAAGLNPVESINS